MSPTDTWEEQMVPAPGDIEFFGKRRSLNGLSMQEISRDYGHFAHLIIKLNKQIPIAGIRSDNRPALIAALEKRVEKDELPNYMIRMGPRLVAEEEQRSFSDRLAAEPPPTRDR